MSNTHAEAARELCGLPSVLPPPIVRVPLSDGGTGSAWRGSTWIASAGSVPELVGEIWEAFHCGQLTRLEREQLFDAIEDEVGHGVRR